MRRLPLYILAGGRSRRFGSDKARATVEHTPLIVRIAEALEPIADTITAVADETDKYADLGLPTIRDATPGHGPLGGLARALEHAQMQRASPWALLAPCDWINPDPALLGPLLDHRGPNAGAIVYRDERWHPLPGLYHASLRTTVSEHLDQGQGAMWRMLEQARGIVPVATDASRRIQQANRPADLRRLC